MRLNLVLAAHAARFRTPRTKEQDCATRAVRRNLSSVVEYVTSRRRRQWQRTGAEAEAEAEAEAAPWWTGLRRRRRRGRRCGCAARAACGTAAPTAATRSARSAASAAPTPRAPSSSAPEAWCALLLLLAAGGDLSLAEAGVVRPACTAPGATHVDSTKMAGLTYLLILLFLLICPGKEYLQGNIYATGFLVLGIVYLPMGLTLIYSAQKRNPHVLLPWIVLNFFFAVCEFVGVVLAPAYAARGDAPCGKSRIALAVFVLQVIIVGCRCYCIAIVTQYRHKMLAAETAARLSDPSRPYTF